MGAGRYASVKDYSNEVLTQSLAFGRQSDCTEKKTSRTKKNKFELYSQIIHRNVEMQGHANQNQIKREETKQVVKVNPLINTLVKLIEKKTSQLKSIETNKE